MRVLLWVAILMACGLGSMLLLMVWTRIAYTMGYRDGAKAKAEHSVDKVAGKPMWSVDKANGSGSENQGAAHTAFKRISRAWTEDIDA